MDMLLLENFLSASVRMATPLLIAALGMVVSERAGLINIGAEGIMLMASFAGYAGAKISGNYWIGMLWGILAALAIQYIFALATIRFKAKQIIVGAALNIFCAGASSFLYRLIFFGTDRLADGIAAVTFPTLAIPFLSELPLIGHMFFYHNIVVYFGLCMVGILWAAMNKTSLGLKLIAVGDHPLAADTLGVNVVAVRYGAALFSGAMMGVSGTFLSIAQASSFGENGISGKGFIALAVVILGKWSPLGVLWGALLFGGANALQMLVQLSGVDIPRNVILMVPYIATVLAVLAVSRHKVGAPRALGIPYEKE